MAERDKTNQEKLEDNMSLSEIIERRFGRFKKVTEVKTQKDIERLIITSPASVNRISDVDGSL